MTKGLLKKILGIIYFVIILILVVLFFFYKDLLLNLNLENTQSWYERFKTLLYDNKLISISLYLLLSIMWICFIGIVSPLIFVSAFLFGYFGILSSILSFVLGSIFTFSIANFFKGYLTKVLNMSKKIPNFKEKSMFLFAIFRMIPGIPFIIKNILAILFNLTYRQFIFATLIAEVPQIILYTYIFKKLIDTLRISTSELSLEVLTSELFVPSILLLIFFIVLFILKNKFSKYFSEIS